MKWFVQLTNIDAESNLHVRFVYIEFMAKPCEIKSKTKYDAEISLYIVFMVL